MKKLSPVLLALVAMALALLVFQSEAPGASAKPPVSPPNKPTIYKFVSNGPYASVDWSDGSISGHLGVGTNGTGRDTVTSLVYYIYECDDDGCDPIQAGWGTIPNEDFERGLKLHTDTSAIPGFTPAVGSGGVISVDWELIAAMSGRQQGTYQYRYFDYRFHSNGTWEWSRASVQGEVVGIPIAGDIFGEAGKNHNVTVEISRGD